GAGTNSASVTVSVTGDASALADPMGTPTASPGACPVLAMTKAATVAAVAQPVTARIVGNSGDFDILDLSVSAHPPDLDGVVVVNVVGAADIAQRLFGGLDIAGFIDRTRQDEHLGPVPVHVMVETGQRL